MHFSIRQQILDLQLAPESVEVEFRIGMLVSGKRRRWQSSRPAGGCIALQQEMAMKMGVEFVAGVDEAVVGRLRQVLTAEGYTGSYTEQRVRTGSTGGLRCVVDAQGRETTSEMKKKVLRLDLACVGHQYDARLEVATEVPGNSAGGSAGSSGHCWTRERLKRRTTYVRSAPQQGAWQVDLTSVTTTALGADGARGTAVDSTELELELTRSALQLWLGCRSEEECHKCTSQITTELMEVLNLCVTPTSEEGAAQLGAKKSQIVGIPRSSGLVTEVTRLNGSIISAAKIAYAPDKFLGTMPLNISRRNLLLLEREDYFVTEKSDGVRYLLYVVRSGHSSGAAGAVTAVFVDRAGNHFRPPGADAIAKGLKAGTVLDGEIVFNLRYERNIFLVFDILCNEGQPCAQLPFEERSALIAGPVMARVGGIDYKSPEEPLWIIRKKFWPKKELKTLMKLMVYNKGRRIYRESDRRYHKSDGLIFQPNAPYVFGTDVTLVKWKWPELASVDLQVEPNRRPGVSDEPSLMAGGPDGTQVDCCMRGSSHVGMGVFDTYRLLADVEDSTCLVHIAEVAFNTKVGLWSYFQLRKDKSEPNYINTVMSILLEQAEDVNIGELEARVLSREPGGGAGAVSSGSGSGGK